MQSALKSSALLGGLLSAPLIAVMYLASQAAGLPFAPFDLFDGVTRILPGPVITFAIDLLIDTLLLLGLDVAASAKTAEMLVALIGFLALGVVAGGLFAAFLGNRAMPSVRVAGLLAGALFGGPSVAAAVLVSLSPIPPLISVPWLTILFLGWGMALAQAARRVPPAKLETAIVADQARAVELINRRKFLIRLGGSVAAITVVGSGLGALLARSGRSPFAGGRDGIASDGTVVRFPNADDPVQPVPGTRAEYTPVDDHYKVFIRIDPTVINSERWELPITGLVENPLTLTLEDLRTTYRPRHQFVTLNCISGRIPTSLISTTLWTGLSVQNILADLNVRPEARYLRIISADSFHETVDLDLIAADERIMLCYAWDGKPLPVEHGFPLRIWIPDRYGMKQPKWIWRMEITDEYKPGYWVERQWDKIAQVKATAVIDAVAVDHLIDNGDQTLVPIGGFAFAGARGISKVDVRIDGGPWETAQLREPLSETTWVSWRYEWPFAAGEHTFEVRCAEGDGTPMIEAENPPRPSGATGIHRREVDLKFQ